jgi:hypothetical protein
MSAIDQIESGRKSVRGEGGKLTPVGNKLTPIFNERAAMVKQTIQAYNAAEDRFIAEQLGATSLEVGESPLDVNALFA